MEQYGQGGTTAGYLSHTEGTGGCCQLLYQSNQEFEGYDYYVDSDDIFFVVRL